MHVHYNTHTHTPKQGTELGNRDSVNGTIMSRTRTPTNKQNGARNQRMASARKQKEETRAGSKRVVYLGD